MSGNREERPLISALQREAFKYGLAFSLSGWRGGLYFQQVSGTPPFVASRMPQRGLINPQGSLNSGGDVLGFFSGATFNLVFFRFQELAVFFCQSFITVVTFISNLPFESNRFKGNRAHLRSAQWLKDIKQTERWDQY